MRAQALGVAVCLLASGAVAVARPALAAGDPTPGRTVTIQASQGKPVQMATRSGPAGTAIPVGACGAVIDGHVWVLPCSDARVVAYQRQVALAHAARHRVTELVVGLGGDLSVIAIIGSLEWRRRRGG